jgi:serine/threonine protein kinase
MSDRDGPAHTDPPRDADTDRKSKDGKQSAAESVQETQASESSDRDNDQAQSIPPGSSSNRYNLGDRLGEGGMATVYAATDTGLGRTVAVKCMKSDLAGKGDFRRRFFDEASIMAELDHPGNIPVYEAGTLPEGEVFYSMKKVRGRTLHDLLRARSAEDIRSRHSRLHFIDIFERVCQTMASAHVRNIIHRDLKPDNIMTDEFGAVYVMDWGLAKRLRREDDDADSSRTRHGAVMGTPAYMSPELASGQAYQSDCQTDVFSLGVILYEILTGVNPFAGESARESMKGIMLHDPEDPRKWNPRAGRVLSAVCMKSLQKDPRKRYRNAGELAEDIRKFREFRPVSAVRSRLTDRLYNWYHRRPALATFLGTFLFLAMLVAGSVVFQASIEAHTVGNAYELLENLEIEKVRVATDIDRTRAEVEALPAGSDQRAGLERRLFELEGRRVLQEDLIRAVAFSITGFTLFTPEERARKIIRDDFRSSVRTAIDGGQLYRARGTILFLIQTYEGRNLFDISAETYDQMKVLLEDLERQIVERDGEILD